MCWECFLSIIAQLALTPKCLNFQWFQLNELRCRHRWIINTLRKADPGKKNYTNLSRKTKASLIINKLTTTKIISYYQQINNDKNQKLHLRKEPKHSSDKNNQNVSYDHFKTIGNEFKSNLLKRKISEVLLINKLNHLCMWKKSLWTKLF